VGGPSWQIGCSAPKTADTSNMRWMRNGAQWCAHMSTDPPGEMAVPTLLMATRFARRQMRRRKEAARKELREECKCHLGDIYDGSLIAILLLKKRTGKRHCNGTRRSHVNIFIHQYLECMNEDAASPTERMGSHHTARNEQAQVIS
jgi:hypothetical protein